VAPLSGGGFVVTDGNNNRVRVISASGVITTVAQLTSPRGIVPLNNGGFLVADKTDNRIDYVSSTGSVTTAAGNGTQGFAGDSGPATAAELNAPDGITVSPSGGFLIADSGNNRVRFVKGGPPSAAIASPASGGTYAQGANVPTSFSCTEDIYSPGLTTCRDSTGTSATPSGGTGRLDTSIPGRHSYRVLAVSSDGKTATTTITYTVTKGKAVTGPKKPVLTASQLVIQTVRALVSRGRVRIKAACHPGTGARPCRGTLGLSVTLKHRVKRGRRTITQSKMYLLGHASYSIAAGRSATITVKLTKVGRKVLSQHHRIRVRVKGAPFTGHGAIRTVKLQLKVSPKKKIRHKRR
jgi:hypothetical protein